MMNLNEIKRNNGNLISSTSIDVFNLFRSSQFVKIQKKGNHLHETLITSVLVITEANDESFLNVLRHIDGQWALSMKYVLFIFQFVHLLFTKAISITDHYKINWTFLNGNGSERWTFQRFHLFPTGIDINVFSVLSCYDWMIFQRDNRSAIPLNFNLCY